VCAQTVTLGAKTDIRKALRRPPQSIPSRPFNQLLTNLTQFAHILCRNAIEVESAASLFAAKNARE
jgi:hypothetical protein